MAKTYPIGELARQAGIPVETVRYYEGIRLLPKPARTAGNYRQYAHGDLERLLFIRHCRSLDMSIDEIRQLLRTRDRPDADCGEANAVIEEHILHVDARLSELRRLRRQLLALRQRCRSASRSEHCGVLAGLREGYGDVRKRPCVPHATRGIHRHRRVATGG